MYRYIKFHTKNGLSTLYNLINRGIIFRPNLPYTESVVQEILRMSCIAPLALPHFAVRDISLLNGKWKIPAGTTVLPNLFNIVNNPEEFPEPEKFNPDRFLDEHGNYVKHDHNIVFSIGNEQALLSL
jgi:cytochrome P450